MKQLIAAAFFVSLLALTIRATYACFCSVPKCRSLPLLFSVLLAASSINAQVGDSARIQSLVDEVQSKQRGFSSSLLDYTYTLRRSWQESNDKGEIKKEKIQVFQVFPVAHGKPITVLLSEDGKDLSPVQLAKERARADKEWQKRKKESEQKGVEGQEQDAVFLFQAWEFSMLRTEQYNNRDVIVLNFKPRKDFKPDNSSEKFAASLEGEIWIDTAEKAVVKLDAKLVKNYGTGFAGLIAPLEPGTTLLIERSPISNNIWAITRLEFRPKVVHAFYSKAGHYRQQDEMSDYKPFNREADNLFEEK
ncbi:MAG: hypothetical protein DMF68_04470 [Acidobacteria bacterium]|nr:MAG: hypothetical protein DMF68_04470 [Acidobacteriota bacterium]